MPIPSICWLAALVALLALEAATVGLVSLWFAVGSLCALLTSFFVGNIWVQFAVFLAVSFLCLVIIRPLAKKYADPRRVSTNADRVIGATGLVTEEIDNLAGHGLVNIAGQVWSARSAGEGAVIPAGQEVRVTQIQGVKVLVEPVQSGGPEH